MKVGGSSWALWKFSIALRSRACWQDGVGGCSVVIVIRRINPQLLGDCLRNQPLVAWSQ